MSSYSVAVTKDKLSSLIDKALAGEEVIVTRHGKPIVAIVTVQSGSPTNVRAATALLRKRLEHQSSFNIPTERFYEWLYQDDAD